MQLSMRRNDLFSESSASRQRFLPLLILKELAQIIIKYLVRGLSKKLKKLFTLILRKEEKKNYSLPSIYRPITLKNTLLKLAKKVLTIHIIGKVEAETLLL